ncbi:uncharacterized protein BDZ99DRAFT_370617, partial [Mytilinidion resinicola]
LSAPTPSSSSSSACPMAQIYTLPTTDAACAVPNKPASNYTAVMAQCCHAAPVTKYADGCGLYCLAAGQSIGELSTCLTGNGVGVGEAFCNKNTTSTATGKVESSGASKTSAATQTKRSATGTAAAGATSTGAAASGYVRGQGMSKAGVAVLGLLLLSSAVGVFL